MIAIKSFLPTKKVPKPVVVADNKVDVDVKSKIEEKTVEVRPPESKAKSKEPLFCKEVDVEDDENNPNVCPICMAEKLDIQPVKHLVPSVGDTSQHRMCKACMDELIRVGKGHTCPFCNELTTVVEFADWIEKTFKRISSAKGDLQASAAVLEQIQIFELEHEG